MEDDKLALLLDDNRWGIGSNLRVEWGGEGRQLTVRPLLLVESLS